MMKREMGQDTIQEVMLDLQSGNIGSYINYLKDIVEEECEQSVRAGVLIERLKSYEPDLSSNIEPMAYVNYCEKEELANPRCQKLADLDSRVAEQDKAWYAERNSKTQDHVLPHLQSFCGLEEKRCAGAKRTADCRKTGWYGWGSQNN